MDLDGAIKTSGHEAAHRNWKRGDRKRRYDPWYAHVSRGNAR